MRSTSQNVIQLDPSHLVGRGKRRECYAHPADDKLCIKVIVNGDGRESRREAKYYQHLKRRNISWQLLARYHGSVKTNLGEGDVFDLVRDSDGKVARTFHHYLTSPEELNRHQAGLVEALAQLRDYLLRERVITVELKERNMVYRRNHDGCGEMVLVDNLGTSDFLPVCYYVGSLAERRVRRTWQRFMTRLPRMHPNNTALREMIAALNDD
ncbi:MAG TPA: YrbL family protein [Verrucomicrobiota bacterium]|nr:YrbL family protein [Verrucomicrobiota bacterium]